MTTTKMPYWQQLQDSRWQRKRLEVLQRANFTCENCQTVSDGERLEVHHKFYEKGRLAWEYELNAFSCLCEVCHETVADAERILLSTIKPEDGENTLQLAYAIHTAYELGFNLNDCSKAIWDAVSEYQKALDSDFNEAHQDGVAI